jgi:hypothetical protein
MQSPYYPPGVTGSEPEIVGMSLAMESYIENNWPKDVVAFLTEHISSDEEDWPEFGDARDDKIFEILAEQYDNNCADEPDYDYDHDRCGND